MAKTVLQAVNDILRRIGQVPVRDVPDSGRSDARVAFESLTANSEELQSEGYYFNTDENVELPLEPDGRVVVPEGTTRLSPVETYKRYGMRGGYVYDMLNNTFVFKEPIKVNRQFITDFEDLPDILQRYVIVRTGRVFANQVIGAGEQNSYNQEDEARARAAWFDSVNRDMDLNLFSNTSHYRPQTTRPVDAITRR